MALPLAVAVIPLSWLLQALSLAVYSVLAAAADRRAAQMLRIFSMLAALGLIGASAVPGLVAFASWRIEGNGLSFAREEAC